MITSLALSLIAIASGTLLTYTYDDAPLAARLCSGACIGFALMGLVGLILALCLGLNPLTIGMTAGSCCCRLDYSSNKDSRSNQYRHPIGAAGWFSRIGETNRWAYPLSFSGVLIVVARV